MRCRRAVKALRASKAGKRSGCACRKLSADSSTSSSTRLKECTCHGRARVRGGVRVWVAIRVRGLG